MTAIETKMNGALMIPTVEADGYNKEVSAAWVANRFGQNLVDEIMKKGSASAGGATYYANKQTRKEAVAHVR